ncbi:MAG TPA: methyltransferase domain-containing protein [Polyangiaceae bacterium]|nr:methyltransferase domain-containing protein [Polyangiaceae bacterium]
MHVACAAPLPQLDYPRDLAYVMSVGVICAGSEPAHRDKEPHVTADAAFWNNLAEKYAQKPVEDPAAFERKITITKSLMRPTDTVLDVGCGTGSLALRLAPSAAHVHGLDLSSEMIRIARGKASAAEVTNVTFHVGPFDDSFSVFEDESLRGICAYSLLHLVDDLPAALARAFRLLEPGGFFVSSTVCLGESWVPYGPLLWLMRTLGKAPSVKILDKRTLEGHVKRAGFVDIVRADVGARSNIAFLVAAKPR